MDPKLRSWLDFSLFGKGVADCESVKMRLDMKEFEVRYVNASNFDQLQKVCEYDVGWGIRASGDGIVYPGEVSNIGTGVILAIPVGYEGVIVSRAGLAVKYRVYPLETPIDPGYRGEVFIVMCNAGRECFYYIGGDWLAQLVVRPVFVGRMSRAQDVGGLDVVAGKKQKDRLDVVLGTAVRNPHEWNGLHRKLEGDE